MDGTQIFMGVFIVVTLAVGGLWLRARLSRHRPRDFVPDIDDD
jgi:hypothetical protein